MHESVERPDAQHDDCNGTRLLRPADSEPGVSRNAEHMLAAIASVKNRRSPEGGCLPLRQTEGPSGALHLHRAQLATFDGAAQPLVVAFTLVSVGEREVRDGLDEGLALAGITA